MKSCIPCSFPPHTAFFHRVKLCSLSFALFLLQGFLDANLKCFWNGALIEAMKVLEFQGYIAPGVLLVTGSPCALEVVRAAWARNVLKPPNNYVINVVGKYCAYGQ